MNSEGVKEHATRVCVYIVPSESWVTNVSNGTMLCQRVYRSTGTRHMRSSSGHVESAMLCTMVCKGEGASGLPARKLRVRS